MLVMDDDAVRHTSSQRGHVRSRVYIVFRTVVMILMFLALLEVVLSVGIRSRWAADYILMPPPPVMGARDEMPKAQVATKLSEIEAEFERRKNLYESGCPKTPRGKVSPLLSHLPSRLAVCVTPKVGCTFWKRIMIFLNGNYSHQRAMTPFDIDRYFVHHGVKGVTYTHSFKERVIVDMDANLTKVLFVRDPYARLWSAYLDKIFLPDYWTKRSLPISGKSHPSNRKCPKEISFEQFLRFSLLKNNNHWEPLSHLCDPCSFQPQYIGKMETFSRDSAYILNKKGLGHLMANKRSHTSRVQDELELLIRYNFKLYEKGILSTKCLRPTDLAERLWIVFQYNGYFSRSVSFPRNILAPKLRGKSIHAATDIVTEFFVNHFKRQARSDSLSSWHEQRNKALIEAYRNIPNALLHAIAKKYVNDFILFDYEQYPRKYFKN